MSVFNVDGEIVCVSLLCTETRRKACICPELTCNGQIRLFVFNERILENLREVGSQIAERLGKIIRIEGNDVERGLSEFTLWAGEPRIYPRCGVTA